MCAVVFSPEVTRAPESVNITENGSAVFNCVASNADQISFLINGQAFADNMDGITSDPIRVINKSTNESIRSLTIKANVMNNLTNISCIAFFSGVSSEPSYPALLLVQGTCIYICMYTYVQSLYMHVSLHTPCLPTLIVNQ